MYFARRAGADTFADAGRALAGPVGVALLMLSALTLVLVAAEYLATAGARLWLAHAGWSGAGLVAVVGVSAAMFRSARRDRPGWALLLGGCLAWLVGALLWVAYSLTSFPASPNAADVLWLVFALVAAAGVHRLGLGSWRSRQISWLEVGPLVAAVCALMTALWWSEIQNSSLSTAGQVTALAYPIVYISAALLMVQSALVGELDVVRNRGMAAVLAGLVIEALAFILWCPQLLAGTYVVGTNPLDAMWSVGMILVGIGAWAADPPHPVAEAEVVRRGWGGVLPSLTFVTLVCAQLSHVIGRAPFGARLALSLGVAMVGITLIARASVLRRQQAQLLSQLHERERELANANRRLSQESRRDPLTGLANRLRLQEDFVDLASGMERYGHGYCLVLFDLDRFKDYNDGMGHQAGDLVLRQVAALLDARAGDRVYRYGGEELLLVLRVQDAHTGRAVAERHRATVQATAIPHPHNIPAGVVTLSGGVAAAHVGETPDEVLRRADTALYAAKAQGRNRITVAESIPTAPCDTCARQATRRH